MRHEESPELFGAGCGAGTCGDITCEICGTSYNVGNDATENYSGDSELHTTFAGLTVCHCCFGKIEAEVLHRMPDILTWYRRILDKKKESLAGDEEALRALAA